MQDDSLEKDVALDIKRDSKSRRANAITLKKMPATKKFCLKTIVNEESIGVVLLLCHMDRNRARFLGASFWKQGKVSIPKTNNACKTDTMYCCFTFDVLKVGF